MVDVVFMDSVVVSCMVCLWLFLVVKCYCSGWVSIDNVMKGRVVRFVGFCGGGWFCSRVGL